MRKGNWVLLAQAGKEVFLERLIQELSLCLAAWPHEVRDFSIPTSLGSHVPWLTLCGTARYVSSWSFGFSILSLVG